jgi:TP901 family phage tail tape measure protein
MYKVVVRRLHDGARGLKVMKAAAEGAKVGGADLTTVADALTTVMKDYGIGREGEQHHLELIATVSRGKTTMEDLAGSLHSVLPNAQAVGISLNDVLGALATMTQEGISADQATQNLNHTIVSLANPTHVQAQEMAAMGLNATTVAKQLGKRGLTGTLNELVNAITSHMGQGGLVLQKSFTDSSLAAQSANTMFKSLPASVKTVASAYQKGSITQKTWTTAVKDMTPANANLAKQWAATQNASKGFSQQLKSGSGTAQTFTGALAKMTGGQTGLQVALHITGIHAKDTADS